MSARADQELAGALLCALSGAGRPLSIPRLLGLLGLGSRSRRRLRRLLQDLSRQGRVVSERGRYRVSAGRRLDGVLRDGEHGHPWLELDDRRWLGPIFLGRAGWAGALLGDRVRLSLQGRAGGRLRGRVERIIARGDSVQLGFAEPGSGGRRVILPGSGGVSLPLDGPTAPPAGDAYLAVRVRGGRAPSCRVEAVLGTCGTLEGEKARLLCEFGLSEDFPAAAEAEAAGAADRRAPDARRDLRELPLFTIDPDDARDFDDAVFAEAVPGGFRLWVAIADVGAFVSPGGAVEQEAARRGTSVYLPGRAIPMLPRRLTEKICCLSPGEERAALLLRLDVRGGECAGGSLFPALIRSRRRFTYAEAQAMLDGRLEGHPAELRHLQALAACAGELGRRMRQRGALDLDLPESDIRLDGEGRPAAVLPAVRHDTCRHIEACMVAANEAVARLLRDAGLPAVYRVHRAPEPASLDLFVQTVRALGIRTGIRRRPAPAELARMVEAISAHPAGRFLHGPLLRSMMPAEYSAAGEPHFGLASPIYLHFTSPIRRFPDLMVHRQLDALFDANGPVLDLARPARGARWRYDHEAAEAAARAATRQERRAAQAERQTQALYHAAFLANRIGEEFSGRVCAVGDSGLWVRLEPNGIEGWMGLERMGALWRYEERRCRIAHRGRGAALTLGSPLQVRVLEVDLQNRRVELEPAGGGIA